LDGERGQALIVFTLMLTALLGVVGLVLDVSNEQENHRKMQNAADAAAMAGAYDLPGNPQTATTDAAQWLTKNGSGSGEVVTNSVSSTTFSDDTITVKIQRTVPFSFSRVLGINSGTITATAKVQVQAITSQTVPTNAGGEDTSLECRDERACPFAVWAYRQTDDTLHQIGDIVTFRDNSWVGANVANNDTHYQGNSNDFKGFLRLDTNTIQVGDNLSKGGNACGQEPTSGLVYAYQHNQPVVLPVFDGETGNGQITLHLAGFAALDLHVPANDGTFQCPGSFQGKLIDFQSVSQYLGTSGSQPPSYASCGSGMGACKTSIKQ
jgi:hypothetical protein